MTKRIYMLSEGEYSDYMVGGLYESEVELTEETITELIPEMVAEQFPELNAEEVHRFSHPLSWALRNAIAVHFLGEQPRAIKDYDNWRRWCSKEKDLFNGKDLKLSNFLVRKGILKRLDYEEIHLDEGWI